MVYLWLTGDEMGAQCAQMPRRTPWAPDWVFTGRWMVGGGEADWVALAAELAARRAIRVRLSL